MPAILAIAIILLIWEGLCIFNIVPSFMLPSPVQVLKALASDLPLLWTHTKTTLVEAFWGLLIGTALGFLFALIMDASSLLYKAFYPIIIISQTIPTIAIAPLLVLWFGYEMLPKIILIVIVTFFPITIGTLTGLKSCDQGYLDLLTTMGASRIQKLWYVKLPLTMDHFFSGLKVSASYSVVGAVISEWLGGFSGLGVYMIRVKKAFAFDRMFAVIIIISLVSLGLMGLVSLLSKRLQPWKKFEKDGNEVTD